MNKLVQTVLCAGLAIAAPVNAAEPRAAQDQGTADPKLAEARSIVAAMYPADARQQMIEKMLADMSAPMRQSLPIDRMTDPGLKSLFNDYLVQLLAQQRPLVIRNLPGMMDAMALAYSRQFSLAELKDVHAFAETPSGRSFLSHMTSILGDPAVQKVTRDMMVEAQQTAKSSVATFKAKLIAYLKDHPDAAKQLQAFAEGQTPR